MKYSWANGIQKQREWEWREKKKMENMENAEANVEIG